MKNIKTKEFWLNLSACILIVLWVYTAGSKFIDFQEFKSAMNNQVFAPTLAYLLVYFIPSIELIAAGLLVYKATRDHGFKLSSLLMGIFTIYIILILGGTFSRIPCGCGGVLKTMGWKTHLIFNLFFLSISLLSTYLTVKERRQQAQNE